MFVTIKKYLQENEILQNGNSIIIGVSGGADSVCLLRILKKLQAEYSLRLLAVHVHHGIRGTEADEDAKFVEELCRNWNVPLKMVEVDVPALAREEGLSLEEAGRHARYEIFEQIRKQEQGDKIAVAHHRDDNAETIFWNMLRGSGLRGLAGMEPIRGRIIRPLLCVSRKQIQDWLREQGITWRTDSTNLETDFTRNKLRLQVLPWLEEHMVPGLGERLVRAGRIFKEQDAYFNNKAVEFIQQHNRGGSDQISFSLEELRRESPAIVRYVLRLSIKNLTGSLKDVTSAHIESIMKLSGVGKSVCLPYGLSAWMDYTQLHLGNLQVKKQKELQYRMVCEVFPYKKGQKILESIYTKWFDYDRIKNTIQLRTRKTGDRIQVLPCTGNKKLKDYMIDAKIPKEIRDQIPLLADGSDILWVVGYRMSEAYKVTEETTTVLQIAVEHS